MARHYIQRITSISHLLTPQSKAVLAPSLTQLHPIENTQRCLHAPPTISTSLKSKTTSKRSLYSKATATTTLHSPSRSPSALPNPSAPSLDHDAATGRDVADGPFQFIANAAWHPKKRPSAGSKTSDPYWNHHKVNAGEDAFYQTVTPNGLSMGVADGVGGWADLGVDPALFSWTLMGNAATAAKDKSTNAYQILDRAFCKLKHDRNVPAGSSTACILDLCNATGKMTTCNLGDSAFLLIRDEKVIYQSQSQQHYFNCPYQLTVVPDTYVDRDSFVMDLPEDSDRASFFLQAGDLIVLATDGYFDNMYAHETLALVNKTMMEVIKRQVDARRVAVVVHDLARLLADTAKFLSLDHTRLSPWAKEARAHGAPYMGGKSDDITLVVTLVVQDQEAALGKAS